MINDPKSAQFIAWTDLGTSFVVSNVGEFSRSILGSHFKHNNVKSFPDFSVCDTNVIHLVLQLCAPAKHVRVPQNQSCKLYSLIRFAEGNLNLLASFRRHLV